MIVVVAKNAILCMLSLMFLPVSINFSRIDPIFCTIHYKSHENSDILHIMT